MAPDAEIRAVEIVSDWTYRSGLGKDITAQAWAEIRRTLNTLTGNEASRSRTYAFR